MLVSAAWNAAEMTKRVAKIKPRCQGETPLGEGRFPSPVGGEGRAMACAARGGGRNAAKRTKRRRKETWGTKRGPRVRQREANAFRSGGEGENDVLCLGEACCPYRQGHGRHF